MKKLLVLLLLTLALPAWSEPDAPKTTSEADAAINELREGIVTAFKKGDIDGAMSYLDPQALVTWPNGEVCKTREEVRAFYKKTMAGPVPPVSEIQADPEFTGRRFYSDDSAVLWGNLHEKIGLNNGPELSLNSVFTATVAKRGEHWAVVTFHASVNAFDNPVPSPSAQRMAEWVGAAGLFGGLAFGFMATRLFPRKKPVA